MKLSRSLVLLLPIIIALIVGCKATTNTGGTGPDAVYFAPEYSNLKLESLAYVGLASMAQDPIAVPTTEQLLRSYLLGGQQKFVIVNESVAQLRASEAGATSEYNSMTRGWKDNHTVDQLAVKSLGEKLGFDGFVFADLTHWREEQVDWQSEGNSFTEVGISLAIYETANGLLAWQGEKMERRESIHYRHGQAGSGIYNESETAQRTDRADQLTPKPPPAEEVAETVIQNLLMGLPDQPGGSN